MWFNKTLLKTLERTCELLEDSEESTWSPLTPLEVRAKLNGVMNDIRAGRKVDKLALRVEFAPTGTIQEIAMANGWHDEYTSLAKAVDRFSS